jgi:hypothetical protein
MLPEKLLSLLKRTPNQAKRKPVAKVKNNGLVALIDLNILGSALALLCPQ